MNMRLAKFLLVLLTVFAILFLLSFQAFVSMRSQLDRNKKILEGYRLYVEEDYEAFRRHVQKYGLKELESLERDLNQKLFEKYYSLAIVRFNNGDFSSAYELFEQALERLPQQDERRAELIYLMGQSLAKAGRITEAKTQLSAAIELPDSFYRTQAIKLLIDLYRQSGEEKKAQELEENYGEAVRR